MESIKELANNLFALFARISISIFIIFFFSNMSVFFAESRKRNLVTRRGRGMQWELGGGGRYVSAGPFRGTHTPLHVARDSHESLQASVGVDEWAVGRSSVRWA